METKTKIFLLGIIFIFIIIFLSVFLILRNKSNALPNLNESKDNLNKYSEIKENESSKIKESSDGKIRMFHNGKGPMCLEALEFFKTIDYPLEQHLNYEPDFRELLNEEKASFEKSEGVSESFGYYPIIFFKDKAYSGFNEEIGESIKRDLSD